MIDVIQFIYNFKTDFNGSSSSSEKNSMSVFRLFCFTSLIFLLYPLCTYSAEQKIRVWNYYEVSPFTMNGRGGLAEDFVKLLNKEGKGKFHFQLETIPRARLNLYLSKNLQGIVLFVNWAWMGKESKKKYLWTPSILTDHNEIISSMENKIFYEGPDSLNGLKFGAVRGRKYKNLETKFAVGEIHRYDINKENQVLGMILHQRVHVTSQPHTIAVSLIRKMGLENKIFFSPKPLFSFSRHIMITKELPIAHSFLSHFALNLDSNEEWKQIMKKYGLEKKELLPASF